MPPPTVRVNTFVKENEKQCIDPISKMFLISELVFGLNRMPLLGKRKLVYVVVSFIIFIMLNGTIIYLTFINPVFTTLNVMIIAKLTQHITSTLLSFTHCKWMLSFYSELSKFDGEAGCRPKVSISSIRNAIQASLTCIFVVMLFVIPVAIGLSTRSHKQFIPLHLVHTLELHYFCHLLSLVTPRLMLINYHLESSLSSDKLEQSPILEEFVFLKSYNAKTAQTHIRKLMDMYEIIVEAYNFLIESIKWQLLFTIITAFITVLGFLYELSLHAISSGGIFTDKIILQVGVPILIMAPLFAPCTFGDSVHNEVIKLRELLASRLYENKLDKSGRSVARALLSFTETRDLSFRLLRMLNIDISMPFKFIGLLVTYLIILLQFEKVMNP